MVGKPVQVELPSGEVVWARVSVDGPTNVSANVIERLDIDDLRRTVQGVATSLRTSLLDLGPDQVQIEFGLELNLKAGKVVSMLAEAGAAASIKIALTWKPQVAPVAGSSALPLEQP